MPRLPRFSSLVDAETVPLDMPENVQLTFSDGLVVPVDCYYVGRDLKGAVWCIAQDVIAMAALHGPLVGLHLDRLPPRSSVVIPLEMVDEDDEFDDAAGWDAQWKRRPGESSWWR